MARISHLSASDVSSIPYHFTAAHTVMVVNMVDIAYTSPSTALNQIEVQKAVARPATRPAPHVTRVCSFVRTWSLPTMERRAKTIVIHATNADASAVHAADMRLTENAMSSGLLLNISATQVNNRPINKKRGSQS